MRKVRSAGELRLLSDVFEVSGATAAVKLNLLGGSALFSCDTAFVTKPTFDKRMRLHVAQSPESPCAMPFP